jgi:dTDP-3,4-didehydro-2,6-dideoxy-alpha-D-glucose 3-reductase
MGCASIARRSMLPAIKRLPDIFELVAVSSRAKDKADSFAKEFGCAAVEGYENLLKENIDAVYIPLPTGLHQEWVNKALLAGKHVYAEKSIALSHRSASSMVINAKAMRVALMEGFMFQYHTQHGLVRQMMDNGDIGEVRSFRSSFGFPPLPYDNFRYDGEIGGGVVYDAGGYTVRAVHFLLGPKFEVVASNLYFDEATGCHTFGSAFLDGANGQSAQVSFGFDNFYQCNYEIWGSKGKITATRAFTPNENLSPEIILEIDQGKKIIEAEKCNHYLNALIAFRNAIEEPESRNKLYEEILLQSKTLDKIVDLSR